MGSISAPKSPYLKTSYTEDMLMRAFDTPFRKKWMMIGIFILIIFPFVTNDYLIHIANMIAIASMGALALNLLCGNAGLLSLGHAAFLGSGAFTTAIMAVKFGMPIWVVLPTAAFVGAILGLIAGLPALRLESLYLGISTLALHYILLFAFAEYQYLGNYSYGISIKEPQIGGFILSNNISWYFFLYIMLLGVALFITNLLRSRPGRAWIAIRNRKIAAEVIGINVGYYKVLAFVVSTSITVMVGSLYAYYTNVASDAEYSFLLTARYLAMIIVGGLGSILGSLMGAFLITLLPYVLMYFVDFFKVSGVVKEYFFAVQSGRFGIIIILFLLVEPLGMVEIWRRIRDYFLLWPYDYKSLTTKK